MNKEINDLSMKSNSQEDEAMFFEPSKKTYYRFPSITSVNNLDSRFYFPEKPIHTQDDVRHDDTLTNQLSDHEMYRQY